MTIAYLSAEIGLYSELHTYSGGLGVLAGDHLKSAADEGIAIAAVTLLYREGYGRQHLDAEGNQTETYPDLDPNKHLEDTGLELEVPLDGHSLKSKIWRAVIRGIEGHEVPVYFLDTRHASNNAIHLNLSDRLYSGGDDMRVRQEYLLGVGGHQGPQDPRPLADQGASPQRGALLLCWARDDEAGVDQGGVLE